MSSSNFDISSQEYQRNPFPTLAGMLAAGEMIPLRLPWIGTYRAVTRYEGVQEMLRDRQLFVREPHHAGMKSRANLPWWFPNALRPLAESMINRDEPDHRRLRSLVELAFVRRNVAQLKPRFEQIADELLDQLASNHRKTGQPVDLIAGLARPFPLAVICELLGLPHSDRPMFMREAEKFAGPLSLWRLGQLVRSMFRITAYVRRQIEICRREPRDGLISTLIAAEHEGSRLSDDELVAMVTLLLMAGHVTTVHLIGGGIATLLRHPDSLARLQADWSHSELAIHELLRFLSPVQFTKPMLVARDVVWRGERLTRGTRLIACLASANVDPHVFEEPEQLNLQRAPNPHVAFGAGIHVCLGSKLAVAEGEIALRRVFSRFPRLRSVVPLAEIPWSQQRGTHGVERLLVSLES